MTTNSRAFHKIPLRASVVCVVLAATLLSGYSLGNDRDERFVRFVPLHVRGVVAGSFFTPPAAGMPPGTSASHFRNAKVCIDANDNGVCDFNESHAITDSEGRFELTSLRSGPVVAEISTKSSNCIGRRSDDRRFGDFDDFARARNGHGHDAAVCHPVTRRNVFRAAVHREFEHGFDFERVVAVTPLSTEVLRMMEADKPDFQTAKHNLATRLGVPSRQVLRNPEDVSDAGVQAALLAESNILDNRFALAAKMVDRHDVSSAELAANPHATGPAIVIKEAQQTAMNLEGIPRYDHIFIIVLENKATPSIKNSKFAPKINAYLNAGNQFISYFATGNPSEPNRLAVGAGDDFGITDDSAWNCMPAGDTADLPEDPLPVGFPLCTNATNHNIKHKPNLFNAMTGGGMTWRIYSGSMSPGQDPRVNGVADATLVAADHVYAADSPVGAIGNPNLLLPFPGGLYATKHNASIPFQNVRSAPEFFAGNRTLGGGQWDEAIKASPNTPAGWDVDQFGTDLAKGDVAQLNYLEPDQCDDMHGITVRGTIAPSTTLVTASDCSGNAAIVRSDNYTDFLIKKIQASALWNNTQKRVAIVISFDEGTATTGFNSCCGWNPSVNSSTPGKSLGPVVKNSDGSVSNDTTIARYNQGNKGHGTSIFGVLTNQPAAPKGVVDSDAYSHISFVRTLQDMFALADPGDDWSYMNRSKYSEKFIAANLPFLPEYAGSADPHFDAVRPMNHAFVIPVNYLQKGGFVTPPGPQVGADADQRNPWALK